MITPLRRTWLLAVLGLVLAVPAGAQNVPAWVRAVPTDTEASTFFVVSGPDEESATLALIDQVNRLLGVRIKTESTATETATESEYRAQIVGVVKQSASGTLAGLKISGRYEAKGTSGVTLYLLGEYRKEDLEREKARRAEAEKAAEDELSRFETQGREAEDRGEVNLAFTAFGEAAKVAAEGRVLDAAAKRDRNLQAAFRTLERITVVPVSGPAKASSRLAFEGDFVFQVADKVSGRGLAGVSFVVTYAEADGAKTRMKRLSLASGPRGVLAVRLPPPTVLGNQKLSVDFDAVKFLQTLEALGPEVKEPIEALTGLALRIRTTFAYQVTSRAKEVPTVLVVLSPDPAGASGLGQKLTQAGFSLSPAPADLGQSGSDPAALLAALRASTKAQRVIVASPLVEGLDDRGASEGVFARVSGNAVVYEIASGAILWSTTKVSNARGANAEQARSAGFLKWGQDVGDLLARELP